MPVIRCTDDFVSNNPFLEENQGMSVQGRRVAARCPECGAKQGEA